MRENLVKIILFILKNSPNIFLRSLISLLKTEWFYLAFTFCHCSAMICPGNLSRILMVLDGLSMLIIKNLDGFGDWFA